MAYQLSTVRQRIIDDLRNSEASTSLVDGYINDTQREIFNNYQLPFNEDTFSGELTIGQYEFDLRSSVPKFQRPIIFRITSPDDDEFDLTDDFKNYKDFRHQYPDPSSQDNKLPGAWTMYAGKLIFNTPVDKTYTLDMDYTKAATTLENDSDIPELPEEFQEILILGAKVRFLENDDDEDKAEYHRSKPNGYTQQVIALVNRYRPVQIGKTTVMRNTRRRR